MKVLEQEIAIVPCPNMTGLNELQEHFFFFLMLVYWKGQNAEQHHKACWLVLGFPEIQDNENHSFVNFINMFIFFSSMFMHVF